MNVKYSILLPVIAALFAFTAPSAQAQDIKIGLVDMQEALNKYNKTQKRTDEINARASQIKSEGEVFLKALQAMKKKIDAETAIVQDVDKNDETRQKAVKAREALMKEYGAKNQEMAKAGQKAGEEMAKARKEMETELVGEITAVMKATAESKGVDLVFDKSFLPMANKAIIYSSKNVLDMTQEIVDQLNK